MPHGSNKKYAYNQRKSTDDITQTHFHLTSQKNA